MFVLTLVKTETYKDSLNFVFYLSEASHLNQQMVKHIVMFLFI